MLLVFLGMKLYTVVVVTFIASTVCTSVTDLPHECISCMKAFVLNIATCKKALTCVNRQLSN